MLEIVRRLSRERAGSAIIVLHDINLAARFCDEILAMRQGELVARGTPSEIMNTEMLAKIYGIDMGILAHPHSGEPISYVR
jgi:iron complex transport system ATP-binding protein